MAQQELDERWSRIPMCLVPKIMTAIARERGADWAGIHHELKGLDFILIWWRLRYYIIFGETYDTAIEEFMRAESPQPS